MMNPRIYYWTNVDSEIETMGTRYILKPEKKFPWLQRALFWGLRKLGATEALHKTVYSLNPRQCTDIVETLLRQHQSWIKICYRQEPHIYMGIDDEKALLAIAQHIGMWSFDFAAKTRLGGRDGLLWCNIPVTVVPGMTGAFIVPAR